MAPTVSVALCVYNGEKFVADSIRSVLEQDWTDLELLISDNASTNSTGEICREFAAKDPRVRYHRHETNIGLAKNFTWAARQTTGRYFKWMAADDMLGPGYLSKCVEVLDSRPDVAMVTTRPLLVAEDGSTLPFDERTGSYPGSYSGRPIDVDNTLAFSAPTPHDRFGAVLMSLRGEALNNFIYALFRNDLLQGVPLFAPFVGADKVLISRMSLQGRLVELPDQLFIWRNHDAQFGSQDHAVASRIWNPKGHGRIWMGASQIRGYLAVVVEAPIGLAEKMRCLAIIGSKGLHGLRHQVGEMRPREGRAPSLAKAVDDH